MRRFSSVMQQGRKAIQDSDLLKILQAEINHELTTPRFQVAQSGSVEDFVLEWDSQQTHDVLLRKKCESGEEVAVSALLGEENYEGEGDGEITREVFMKVCIKRPGLSSILQFNCEASSRGVGKSGFNIRNAYYIPSPSTLDSSTYRGPIFRDLDPKLQYELKQYLQARGIGESLTNFLLLHLQKKEQDQYVNWLQKLKAMVTEE